MDMESRSYSIESKNDSRVSLKIIPGHFVTSHSHITHYIDMTTIKARQNEAEAAARIIAGQYATNTIVDTIVCLNGCEVIGAFLANELTKSGILSMNAHQTIYITSPEQDINGQMIFRDNSKMMVDGKHVLILSTSITTGVTVEKAISSVEYYGGNVCGISAIFSFIESACGINILSIFDSKNLEGYATYDARLCPMCRAGQRIDAIVNGFGYSRL